MLLVLRLVSFTLNLLPSRFLGECHFSPRRCGELLPLEWASFALGGWFRAISVEHSSEFRNLDIYLFFLGLEALDSGVNYLWRQFWWHVYLDPSIVICDALISYYTLHLSHDQQN